MAPPSALAQILILLAITVCAVALVHRVRLPAIIGYLAVGMLVGPQALDVIENREATQLLAEFGVVFLVFTLGLEFSLPRLIAMRWEVFGVGGAQVLLTTGVIALIAALAFHIQPSIAVVIGGAVAMSSTAIIVSQLTEQSENNRTHGRLAVAICLFQDLAFTVLLGLVSAIGAGGSALARPSRIALAVLSATIALVIVIAAGRWALRPLFMAIAAARSAELFLLAVLLVVLASAWATQAVGLSLAVGAFLAGMMLAETEFRHQVEATIRSFRDVLIGLFFVTIGMLLDIGLLTRHALLVTALLAGMLLIKAALAALASKPATGSWFKAVRVGLVVGAGGEFGFALLTLLLSNSLAPADIVQPLLAATVISMVISPLVIRHNRRITRFLLRERGPPQLEPRELESTRALAERDHVVICGFGRVGQNIARVLEQHGFEYIALDLDPVRIRAGRQAGDALIYGDARQVEVLENVGLANASCVVITFASPAISLRILTSVRKLRADVPVLVRTQDDSKLDELQNAGATEVVPETFEASLMLLSHLLVLLEVPVPRVLKSIEDIRTHRYGMLRRIFRDEGAALSGDRSGSREAVSSVILPPTAWAVGRTIGDVNSQGSRANVSAVRRDGIVGRDPAADTVLKEGDVVVLYGTPESLEHAEGVLLMG